MSITDELKSTISRMRSITDELRRVAAKTEGANGRCAKLYRGDLDHVADRIDAELAERYVKLPVDADDMPIHIGDEMVFLDLYGNKSEPFVVEGFESPDMWLVHCDEGRVRYTANPMHTRHYHEPTVEGVLEGFARAYDDIGGRPDEAELWRKLLAEYAAKLELAGEDK